MNARDPRGLFLHDLSDIYAAEQQIVEILPQLASEVSDDRVRTAFTEHERQTRDQIRNIERCFEILGAQPEGATCHAVQGLKEEHDAFVREGPPPNILTMFDLGAESKTEHYEIASYRGLVDKADLMGQDEVSGLLRQNLQQEEEMSRKIEQLSRDLGQEQVQGMR